jgi:putative ABC transport system ATP-binding protein
MQSIIEINHISKEYLLGEQLIYALKDVSLEIKKNEYVALMGPSGSGKSTLMNILGCLDTPTKGTYTLNNTEVSRMDDDQLAFVRNKEIGFVFQTFNLLPRLTSFENVALPLIYAGIAENERKERTEKVMEMVGLQDRMKNKPNQMSGGQRQRVAIARALINNPSIILADEPTGNLDPETANEVMQLLIRVNREHNTSIVFATHNYNLIAKHPSRILKCENNLVSEETGIKLNS